jgi:hypothetical protein
LLGLRLVLSGVIALGLVTGAAACQSAPAVSNEQLVQAVAELRAEVAALKRTVARLEQELAEAKAEPAATVATQTAAPAAKATASKTQCAGTTQAGARCKRSAQDGSRFCWQHAGK